MKATAATLSHISYFKEGGSSSALNLMQGSKLWRDL